MITAVRTLYHTGIQFSKTINYLGTYDLPTYYYLIYLQWYNTGTKMVPKHSFKHK